MGAWGPLAFVAVYVAVVVCMMPAFLLIIVGGAVFGLVKGALYSMAGAMLGGTCAFLIARHFARGFVAQRVASRPKLRSIDRVVGEDGLKIVILLRLSAAVPFVLSNYVLGVTRVRTRDFVIGTVGLMPTVLTYAAYGAVSGATSANGAAPVSTAVVSVGVAATIILGIVMTRIAQRAIRDAEGALPDEAA